MGGVKHNAQSGTVLADSRAMALGNMASTMATALYPPVTKDADEKLAGLAEEIDFDEDETRKLYQLFTTSPTRNEEGKAKLSELLNELLRTSELFATTDEQVSDLLGCDYWNTECKLEAEERYVTF